MGNWRRWKIPLITVSFALFYIFLSLQIFSRNEVIHTIWDKSASWIGQANFWLLIIFLALNHKPIIKTINPKAIDILLVALILLLSFYARLTYAGLWDPPWSGANAFQDTGLAISQGNFQLREAPSSYSTILGYCFMLFGHTVKSIHFLNIALAAFSAVIFYLLFRQITEQKFVSFILTIPFILNKNFIYWSGTGEADSIIALLTLLGILFIILLSEIQTFSFAILSWLTLAYLVNIRVENIIYFPLLVALYLFLSWPKESSRKESRKECYHNIGLNLCALSILLIFLLPNLAFLFYDSYYTHTSRYDSRYENNLVYTVQKMSQCLQCIVDDFIHFLKSMELSKVITISAFVGTALTILFPKGRMLLPKLAIFFCLLFIINYLLFYVASNNRIVGTNHEYSARFVAPIYCFLMFGLYGFYFQVGNNLWSKKIRISLILTVLLVCLFSYVMIAEFLSLPSIYKGHKVSYYFENISKSMVLGVQYVKTLNKNSSSYEIVEPYGRHTSGLIFRQTGYNGMKSVSLHNSSDAAHFIKGFSNVRVYYFDPEHCWENRTVQEINASNMMEDTKRFCRYIKTMPIKHIKRTGLVDIYLVNAS